MKNSKAIVTLAIGEKYLQRWKTLCEPNWRAYAARHGYDIVCLTEPLDRSERASRRSPAWQKCLILSEERVRSYERVVWIDSDIVINAHVAPCVTSMVPPKKVGAVDAWASPSPEIHEVALARAYDYWGSRAVINPSAKEFYSAYGLLACFDQVVQTGMLVLSPDHHREVLEHTYFNYEERGGSEWSYEMRPLSYELIARGLVEWVDSRFNVIWFHYKAYHYPFLLAPATAASYWARVCSRLRRHVCPDARRACIATAFLNSWFLHFAGAQDDFELVDTDVATWRQCSL